MLKWALFWLFVCEMKTKVWISLLFWWTWRYYHVWSVSTKNTLVRFCLEWLCAERIFSHWGKVLFETKLCEVFLVEHCHYWPFKKNRSLLNIIIICHWRRSPDPVFAVKPDVLLSFKYLGGNTAITQSFCSLKSYRSSEIVLSFVYKCVDNFYLSRLLTKLGEWGIHTHTSLSALTYGYSVIRRILSA